jgi:hypothetical protein
MREVSDSLLCLVMDYSLFDPAYMSRWRLGPKRGSRTELGSVCLPIMTVRHCPAQIVSW